MAGTGKAHLRSAGAVLRAEDLVVEFPLHGGKRVHAVSGDGSYARDICLFFGTPFA